MRRRRRASREETCRAIEEREKTRALGFTRYLEHTCPPGDPRVFPWREPPHHPSLIYVPRDSEIPQVLAGFSDLRGFVSLRSNFYGRPEEIISLKTYLISEILQN